MAKKKKGKKKKKVKFKAAKSKKPSEKTLLTNRVAELEKDLGVVSSDLENHEARLEEARRRHSVEVECKEACVEYLKRVLQTTTIDLMGVQQQLQRVRDLAALAEKRTSDLSRNIQRSSLVKRSIFLQQQTEIEDKLSRLEELRLKRTSQLTQLRRVEGELEAKATSDRSKNREESRAQVGHLLQIRRKFERLTDSFRSDSREVYELSLPVYSRHQLDENMRLRTECHQGAEDLLEVQDRSRHLKQVQKTLDIELETQVSAESKLEDLELRLENRQNELLEEGSRLQSHCRISEKVLEGIRCEIRALWRKTSRVDDKLVNAEEILRDQRRYKQSLEGYMKKRVDRNGLMTSRILRAGLVIKDKVGEVEDTRCCMDLDLLKQLCMLLEQEDASLR